MDHIVDIIKDFGDKKKFSKGELLFSAEDKANGFYYVRSGEIRIYKMDEKGKEIEVVRLGPGDFLGEAVVFVSPVFPAFAQAVKDSCVLFFEKESIIRNIEKDSSLVKFFLNLLARKCVKLNKRIETLSLRTVRQRLAQYLLTKCEENQPCIIDLKIKKKELAQLIGTVSETLSRNLKQMQDEGLIEVKGNTIQVKDSMKLRDVVVGF